MKKIHQTGALSIFLVTIKHFYLAVKNNFGAQFAYICAIQNGGNLLNKLALTEVEAKPVLPSLKALPTKVSSVLSI